jgi:hypothetical protein
VGDFDLLYPSRVIPQELDLYLTLYTPKGGSS